MPEKNFYDSNIVKVKKDFITAYSGKRYTVTVGKCLEILQKLEECLSIDDLAIEYGISQTTIRRYKQQSTSIRELSENPMRAQSKRQRASSYEDMEARLYEWFLARRALGDIVPNALLWKKAKELENEFGSSSNFMASQEWL